MSGLNFGQVESASSEVRESTFKVVEPGLHTLIVEDVQPTVAGTGTAGLVVTFRSREADATFNERFWLSNGALPRVQYLVEKFTGVKLGENDNFAGTGQELADNVANGLAPKLLGKSKTCVVDGEKRTKEKDGKVYINTYPTLRFAGFVDPEGVAAEPIIKDNTASTPATAAPKKDVEEDKDDLPF